MWRSINSVSWLSWKSWFRKVFKLSACWFHYFQINCDPVDFINVTLKPKDSRPRKGIEVRSNKQLSPNFFFFFTSNSSCLVQFISSLPKPYFLSSLKYSSLFFLYAKIPVVFGLMLFNLLGVHSIFWLNQKTQKGRERSLHLPIIFP